MKHFRLFVFNWWAIAMTAATQVSFAERLVYNPVTGRSEPERGRRGPNFNSPPSPTTRAHAARPVLARRVAGRRDVTPTSSVSPAPSEQAWPAVETQAAVDPAGFQTEAGVDPTPFDPLNTEYHWEDPHLNC